MYRKYFCAASNDCLFFAYSVCGRIAAVRNANVLNVLTTTPNERALGRRIVIFGRCRVAVSENRRLQSKTL